MKKLIGVAIVALFLFSFMPAVSSIDGSVEYSENGGGDKVPIEILAIWETNTESYLDDDYTTYGCQIDPPLAYDCYSHVWVYVAVLDQNEPLVVTDEDQVKIDISWPLNNLDGREDLGWGGQAADNLEPVCFATWEEFEAADDIDSGLNAPFICYYNQANDGGTFDGFDYVEWQYFESNVIFFRAQYDLYYHDPAGWYDAEVTIQAHNTDTQVNYFEYVYALSIDPDFSSVDWGYEWELNTWFAEDGDWFWGSEEPTVRNVGNWDTHLGCHFTSGDFQEDKVLFDIRAGDSHPDSEKYNPTYSQANGIDGMEPCNWDYYPIPIDNDFWLGEDTDYDDVLLKCHTMKLDFYLFVIEWNDGVGEYNFEIDLFVWDPEWQPVPGYPCGEPPNYQG
jgi:hypothetical protein